MHYKNNNNNNHFYLSLYSQNERTIDQYGKISRGKIGKAALQKIIILWKLGK